MRLVNWLAQIYKVYDQYTLANQSLQGDQVNILVQSIYKVLYDSALVNVRSGWDRSS